MELSARTVACHPASISRSMERRKWAFASSYVSSAGVNWLCMGEGLNRAWRRRCPAGRLQKRYERHYMYQTIVHPLAPIKTCQLARLSVSSCQRRGRRGRLKGAGQGWGWGGEFWQGSQEQRVDLERGERDRGRELSDPFLFLAVNSTVCP